MFRRLIKKIAILIIIQLYTLPVLAVPVSFLIKESGNLRDAVWHLYETENFKIYYERESYDTAVFAANSLEKSLFFLSSIMKVSLPSYHKREMTNVSPVIPKYDFKISSFSKIPVIINTRVDGGGFANPVYQSIEVQLDSPRESSFYSHELVHRLMYEYHDIGVGPAGRVFSLAMTPPWWIEGVAEYLTKSISPRESQAIIRYMALTQNWQSWDEIHSLYSVPYRRGLDGYALGGAFVEYLEKKICAKEIDKCLKGLSQNTFQPYFISAADNFFKDKTNSKGRELYDDFKQEKTREWKNRLNGLPSLRQAQVIGQFEEEFPTPVTINSNNQLILFRLAMNPFKSDFKILNDNSNEEERKPLNAYASALLDSYKGTYLFITSGKEKDRSKSQQLLLLEGFSPRNGSFSFQKNIDSFPQLKRCKYRDAYVMDTKKAFVIADCNAQERLFFIDLFDQKVIWEKVYHVPEKIKFLKNQSNRNNDVVIIHNYSEELTSLEIISHEGIVRQEILPAGKIYVKSGYALSPNSFRLLIGWHELYAIADLKFTPGQSDFTLKVLAGIWEDVDSIQATGQNENECGLWLRNQNKYDFIKVDTNYLENNFKEWLKINPLFHNEQKALYASQEPPYITYYNYSEHQVTKPPELSYAQQKTQIGKEAPYTFHHRFSYPYPVNFELPFNPTIGFYSIPLSDEMERYLLELTAQFDLRLKAPNFSLMLNLRRIADEFKIGVFSNQKFNGAYKDDKGNQQLHYLRQSGLSLFLKQKIYDLSLSYQFSLSNFSPLNTFSSQEKITEKYNLATFGTSASYKLFENAWYFKDDYEFSERWLYFYPIVYSSITYSHSLGKSYDNKNKEAQPTNAMRTSGGLQFNYISPSVTLQQTNHISKIWGKQQLNMREFYFPTPDSNPGDKDDNSGFFKLPFYSQNTTKLIKYGSTLFESSLILGHPIVKKAHKKFSISYLDSIRGKLKYSYGGIMGLKPLQMISYTVLFDMEINGFSYTPKFAFGHFLAKKNWFFLFSLDLTDYR